MGARETILCTCSLMLLARKWVMSCQVDPVIRQLLMNPRFPLSGIMKL